MRRALLPIPFLLATAAVVWAGLDWPPPLWILEYGLPGSQGPTGRVARIEGIEFVEISSGYFRMGSDAGGRRPDLPGRIGKAASLPLGDPGELGAEMPRHRVEFARPYWIARYELTNRQFEDHDPHYERGPRSTADESPATMTHLEAERFCGRLAGTTGIPVRLPSESEWENACRAGTATSRFFRGGAAVLGDYAWYLENADGRAAPVGQKRPNAWGLHDTYGNVMERCADSAHGDYVGAPTDGSAWSSGGLVAAGQAMFVLRGGSCLSPAGECTSALRQAGRSQDLSDTSGLRPAFTLTPDQEPLVEPYLVEGEE